jgi:hypothetical protein
VLSGLAPLHPRNDTFPGEVFLHLAADALDWCGASRAEPLALEGLRERFLPECAFRGRQNAKLQYAMYAAVACIRAAASRAGVPVRQACQDLNERPGHQAL